MGESITEGAIINWLIDEGDTYLTNLIPDTRDRDHFVSFVELELNPISIEDEIDIVDVSYIEDGSSYSSYDDNGSSVDEERENARVHIRSPMSFQACREVALSRDQICIHYDKILGTGRVLEQIHTVHVYEGTYTEKGGKIHDVAVKIELIPYNREREKRILQLGKEVSMVLDLSHPNIIQYHGCYFEECKTQQMFPSGVSQTLPNTRELFSFIVMERASGGTLKTYLKEECSPEIKLKLIMSIVVSRNFTLYCHCGNTWNSNINVTNRR